MKICEWAHFLNLAKRFWRYLTFSAQKKKDFFSGDVTGNLHISNGTKKKAFLLFSGNKNASFENKGLFDATFYGN